MIGCSRVRKQPISVLYFESENELKFHNLEAWSVSPKHIQFFFVIGNSKQPSHVKQKVSETLTCPGKGLSSFSSMEDITFDPKGVAKLLDEQNEHKTPGMDEQLCLDLYQS